MSETLRPFDPSGYLPAGVHLYTKEGFISTFCQGAKRVMFADAFADLFEWGQANHATSLVIGGTFVTDKVAPGDLDVLVCFKSRSEVRFPDFPFSPDAKIDLQALAEEETEICQAYLQVFAADKRDIPRGLVQVKLHPGVATFILGEESLYFNLALAGYRGRPPFFAEPAKKLVIPIHGIRSHGEWIPKFTLYASLAGWAVAPFVYGYQEVTVLRDKTVKQELVREFRLWIDEIKKIHHGSISIVAHSFGTYLVGRYLVEAEDLLQPFEGIVLAGSILNTKFDWLKYLDEEAVRMVLNTRSSEDEWVKHLSDGGVRFLMEDPLMGRAAVEGFAAKHARVIERTSKLLSHSNMFEADVITGIWLPFLETARRSHSYLWNQDDDVASDPEMIPE
jgi:pimeloyl-ACP methyl ester carboxylesterase